MELGTVIGTRTYDLPTGAKVTLRIGQPRPTPGKADWFCPWRLVEDDAGTVHAAHAAYGVDAVQALQLAMPDIGSALARIPGIRWQGETNLGFPTPDEWLVIAEYRRRRDSTSKK